MEEQPKPLNVVTVELHNIVFANVTLQCYKWIYFADLTQNWWHTQILYAHSKVNFLQHIVFSAFCCLQKTLFKALNQSNRRFPPCAAYFRSSLHCKSTEQILRQSSPAHALNNSSGIKLHCRMFDWRYCLDITMQNSAKNLLCRILSYVLYTLSNHFPKLWMRKQTEMSLCHYLLERAHSFLM